MEYIEMKRCNGTIARGIGVQTEEGQFFGVVTWFKQVPSKVLLSAGRWIKIIHDHLTFKRRIKSHLPFAGIIRSSPYSTRFRDKG